MSFINENEQKQDSDVIRSAENKEQEQMREISNLFQFTNLSGSGRNYSDGEKERDDEEISTWHVSECLHSKLPKNKLSPSINVTYPLQVKTLEEGPQDAEFVKMKDEFPTSSLTSDNSENKLDESKTNIFDLNTLEENFLENSNILMGTFTLEDGKKGRWIIDESLQGRFNVNGGPNGAFFLENFKLDPKSESSGNQMESSIRDSSSFDYPFHSSAAENPLIYSDENDTSRSANQEWADDTHYENEPCVRNPNVDDKSIYGLSPEQESESSSPRELILDGILPKNLKHAFRISNGDYFVKTSEVKNKNEKIIKLSRFSFKRLDKSSDIDDYSSKFWKTSKSTANLWPILADENDINETSFGNHNIESNKSEIKNYIQSQNVNDLQFLNSYQINPEKMAYPKLSSNPESFPSKSNQSMTYSKYSTPSLPFLSDTLPSKTFLEASPQYLYQTTNASAAYDPNIYPENKIQNEPTGPSYSFRYPYKESQTLFWVNNSLLPRVGKERNYQLNLDDSYNTDLNTPRRVNMMAPNKDVNGQVYGIPAMSQLVPFPQNIFPTSQRSPSDYFESSLNLKYYSDIQKESKEIQRLSNDPTSIPNANSGYPSSHIQNIIVGERNYGSPGYGNLDILEGIPLSECNAGISLSSPAYNLKIISNDVPENNTMNNSEWRTPSFSDSLPSSPAMVMEYAFAPGEESTKGYKSSPTITKFMENSRIPDSRQPTDQKMNYLDAKMQPTMNLNMDASAYKAMISQQPDVKMNQVNTRLQPTRDQNAYFYDSHLIASPLTPTNFQMICIDTEPTPRLSLYSSEVQPFTSQSNDLKIAYKDPNIKPRMILNTYSSESQQITSQPTSLMQQKQSPNTYSSESQPMISQPNDHYTTYANREIQPKTILNTYSSESQPVISQPNDFKMTYNGTKMQPEAGINPYSSESQPVISQPNELNMTYVTTEIQQPRISTYSSVSQPEISQPTDALINKLQYSSYSPSSEINNELVVSTSQEPSSYVPQPIGTLPVEYQSRFSLDGNSSMYVPATDASSTSVFSSRPSPAYKLPTFLYCQLPFESWLELSPPLLTPCFHPVDHSGKSVVTETFRSSDGKA